MYARGAASGARAVTSGRARLPSVLSTSSFERRAVDVKALSAAGRVHAGLPPAVAQRLSSFAAVDHVHLDKLLPSRGPFEAVVEPVFPRRGPSQPTLASSSQAVEDDSPVIAAIKERVLSGETNAFCMYDLGHVRDQLMRWRAELPRVVPFYAVKCNPDPRIVHMLAGLGAGFDCASQAEIELVQGYDVPPERVVFANPCKQPSHVAFAASQRINLTVFDGADELYKVQALQPAAQLLLRILVDDSHAVCTMSQKYGAPLTEVAELLTVAKALNLNVVGVSFHVGSGSLSAEPFANAVRDARAAFDIAADMGICMSMVDVGGGFPGGVPEGSGGGRGDESATPAVDGVPPSFEEIAGVLRVALDTHFPAASGVRLIAEPGRYFVSSAATLTTGIIGRKVQRRAGQPERAMYFVNDGVYGSFNCVLYDHATVTPYPLFDADAAKGRGVAAVAAGARNPQLCSIWGPTCDGLDCILQDARLPALSVGDWIRWPNMGAYTSAAGSTFNGMERPNAFYL